MLPTAVFLSPADVLVCFHCLNFEYAMSSEMCGASGQVRVFSQHPWSSCVMSSVLCVFIGADFGGGASSRSISEPDQDLDREVTHTV